ncbi:MAG: hypothetical protein V4612_04685 [Pseudomonadota bacterium]
MKKTFLKSVATGVVGLTLVASCSMFNKETAHKCSSNTCKAKKEANQTSATKAEAHKCNSKKAANKKAKATPADKKATETK